MHPRPIIDVRPRVHRVTVRVTGQVIVLVIGGGHHSRGRPGAVDTWARRSRVLLERPRSTWRLVIVRAGRSGRVEFILRRPLILALRRSVWPRGGWRSGWRRLCVANRRLGILFCWRRSRITGGRCWLRPGRRSVVVTALNLGTQRPVFVLEAVEHLILGTVLTGVTCRGGSRWRRRPLVLMRPGTRHRFGLYDVLDQSEASIRRTDQSEDSIITSIEAALAGTRTPGTLTPG